MGFCAADFLKNKCLIVHFRCIPSLSFLRDKRLCFSKHSLTGVFSHSLLKQYAWKKFDLNILSMQNESFHWHLKESCKKWKEYMSADKHNKLVLMNKHGQWQNLQQTNRKIHSIFFSIFERSFFSALCCCHLISSVYPWIYHSLTDLVEKRPFEHF